MCKCKVPKASNMIPSDWLAATASNNVWFLSIMTALVNEQIAVLLCLPAAKRRLTVTPIDKQRLANLHISL